MRKNIIFLTLLCVMLVMFCGSVSAADVPSANFTSNVTNGTAPLSVQFNDTSNGTPTSWSWDFGDGSNSTDENPVHKYTKAGTYSVSLTAGNDAGNNTVTQTNYITVLLNDAYVSPTGNDLSGDGTSSNPYASIQKALDNVVSGGTVHLRSGTYTGTGNYGLTISKNVNIVGDGQTSTIINAASAGNIFTINSGLNVAMTNLTFANGTTTTNGGAIKNTGSLNVTNCTFTGNKATSYGGAIYNAGSLTVNNSTFIGNTAASAGGIYNYGTLNVTSSVFTGNNGTSFAGAVFGDTGKVTSVSNCTFINNTSAKGGALWNRGTLTVTGCVFNGNVATSNGGAIFNTASGTTNVHYSSFVNNTAPTGSAIYLGTGTVNAECNWWGSNSSPAGQVGGAVDYSNWLYMTMTMDTTNIVNGSTVAVTVNFNTNFNNIYDGTDVVSIDPTDGTIPDGTVVTFTSDLGNFSQVTVTTINGTATTIFIATTLGNSTINATTDNQIISSNITVRLGTNILVNNVTCTNGDTVNLTATLTDGNGVGLPGKTVTINVNGTNYTTTTDGNGSVTVSYATSKAGIYSLIASFAGDSIYHDSSNNGTNYLIVQLNDVYVSPTGNDTIGGGTVSNPFKTLQYSLKCVVDGGTLHVLAGNYTGTGNSGLTIDSNVNIVGDGQTSTIIIATSSGSMFNITMDQYGNRKATLTGTIPGNVFTINPGITVSMSNLTLQNGSAVQGGAIYNNGNLNIKNCTLTGNSVYQSDIYATYQYTYLYTFYNGGAIYNAGVLSIAGCTFTGNCASSSGGAIYNN
ncbi:MAG: PKD domain-containing protein, partial [Methanobacterium paludis]|nr:PKD domain-containing protein [Methanobacterium paludis]